MNPIHILTPAVIAAALVSCTPQRGNEYDTSNPYGTADAGPVNPPVTAPANPPVTAPTNPVYDTPAVYEDAGTTPANKAVAPTIPEASTATVKPAKPAISATPTSPANGPAIIHTVVKGDTLSGISAKYKIPAASIKQANRMTNDTVVLGRKMVIPPR